MTGQTLTAKLANRHEDRIRAALGMETELQIPDDFEQKKAYIKMLVEMWGPVQVSEILERIRQNRIRANKRPLSFTEYPQHVNLVNIALQEMTASGEIEKVGDAANGTRVYYKMP